ncbi:glycosyltransferase, partial [Streptomyces heliomycini]
MRRVVLYIDSLTSGGAERSVLLLSRGLSNKGHHVVVVTVHGEKRDFYTLPKNVHRYSLGLTRKNRGLGKLFYNEKRIRALREILKKEKCDVVIGMMTMCSVLATVSCFGLPTRSITAERNYPGRKPAIKPWGFLRSVFYRFADAHIVQSKETAAWLEKHTGAKNTYIIPNAVSWPLQSFPPSVDPASLLSSDF